jgi:hypothetical protein
MSDLVVEMQAQLDSLHNELNGFLAKDSLLNGETNLLCAQLEDTVFRRDTHIADLVRQIDAVNNCKTYTIANPIGKGLVKMLYRHEVLEALEQGNE